MGPQQGNPKPAIYPIGTAIPARLEAKFRAQTGTKKRQEGRERSWQHICAFFSKHNNMSATKKHRSNTRKWSKSVTEHSDALDLEKGVFAGDDPAKIAASLKRSAKKSHRRKGTPYQSAMSMLNFYINRAGENLSASRKKVLEEAKEELRKVFHREND